MNVEGEQKRRPLGATGEVTMERQESLSRVKAVFVNLLAVEKAGEVRKFNEGQGQAKPRDHLGGSDQGRKT